MTRLVGITGRAGSGKTTAAEALIACGWVRVKFAAPLKDMTRQFLISAGIPAREVERYIEGDRKEQPLPDHLGGVTPRRIMQTIGTEWGRCCIAPDLWVRIAEYQIASLLQDGRRVVVDDCRFDNEADVIRRLGGQVLALHGRDAGVDSGHVSEAGLRGDIEYQNTGTRAELVGFVRYVFGSIAPD